MLFAQYLQHMHGYLLRLECSKLVAISKARFTSIAISARGLVTRCDRTTNVSGQEHPSEEELDAQFASFGDVNDYMSDDEEWVEEQEDHSDSSSTDNTNEAEAQGADVDDFAALQSDILSEAAHSTSDSAQPSAHTVPSPLKVPTATPLSSLGSKPSSHSQTASSPSSVLATCSGVKTEQTAVCAEAIVAEGLLLDTPDVSSTSGSDTQTDVQPEQAALAKSDTSLSLSSTSVLARQQVQKSTAPPSVVQPELQPSVSEGMHIAQLSTAETTFKEAKQVALLHLDAPALESWQGPQQMGHEASELRLPAMLSPEDAACDPRPSAAARPLVEPVVANAK